MLAESLVLAGMIFVLGTLGVIVRRNVIIVLASIELMLNAANLSFVAGSRAWSAADATGGHPLQGPIFALFVILVAAAEAAVGLALIIALYRLKQPVALASAVEPQG